MANQRHVDMLLHDGVITWNVWRKEEPTIRPDLRGADLRGADLRSVDFGKANLREVNLVGAHLTRAHFVGADLHTANLSEANLSEANLSEAFFWKADFRGADLHAANLCGADFSSADFSEADLSGADLSGADLRRTDLSEAQLVGARLVGTNLFRASCLSTNFSGATLTGCAVYGLSAWDVNLEGAVQADLRITPQGGETNITVDNLEVAQFLYVLLHNQRVRAVLDTITSKVVLILGRFSIERKPILDALRETLRRHPNSYIPVLFDFDPQTDKPVFETVKTLANLARFVIADLTDPHMVRSEVGYILPNVPSVPVQPIVENGDKLPIEFDSWVLYRSFLPLYRYADMSHLLASLTESVITPAEGHVQARRL